ncbi:MAG: hypothetical protein R3Y47_05370, partial [Lachnospiraceae bacterium]
KKQLLKMWIDGITFNYEWLLHIGASTKTSNSADNAGYFGEGFKIASLCAIRDFGWDIEMFSGEWKLKVIQLEQAIDGKELFMLAYDVKKKKDKNRSMLVLQGIGKQEFCLFESAIKSFFYPKNTLLGEKIWEGNIGAMYKRSGIPYEENLPCTRDYGKKGLVFCGYQLLGTSPFDLVVCLHRYKKKDRERKSLYGFQVVDVFEKLVVELYDDFFVFVDQIPSRRIICNTRAAYHGMATVFKCKRPLENNRGVAVRYDVDAVYLKKSIFSREGFYDALSTYIHELCHMFGGDASQNFSLGLTMAMEILLSNSETVNCYRDKWRALY